MENLIVGNIYDHPEIGKSRCVVEFPAGWILEALTSNDKGKKESRTIKRLDSCRLASIRPAEFVAASNPSTSGWNKIPG